MEENSGIVTGRSRRQKIDKTGRSAAFERLKSLKEKGSKNKCEIGDVDSVLIDVSEKDYAKRVEQRLEDDWIEDDGGEYVEDGRDIFDDDFDEESILETSKSEKSKKRTKKHVSEKSNNSSKSIVEMIGNMPSKKKKTVTTKAEEDALLGDLMKELTDEKSENKESYNSPMSSKDYLKSLSSVGKRSSAESVIKPKINLTRLSARVSQRADDINVIKDVYIKKEVMTPVKAPQDIEYPDILDNTNDKTMETIEIEEPVEIKKSEPDEVIMEVDHFEDMNIDDFQIENLTDATKEEEKKSVKIEPEVTEKCLTEGWETVNASVNISHENITVDTSTLPIVINKEGEKVFRFYWWDAHEEPFKQPGVVYLFGKVYIESAKTYVSCCVTVKDIPRRIYLLPRQCQFDSKTNTQTDQTVSLLDVYEEFNKKVAEPNKIMNFKSRKILKKYAFELLDVPSESEYLEIKYPPTASKLSADLSGETFSRVFGTNTSSLELLLIERKIKGPCWIEIKNPQPAQVVYSWCKVDVICTKPEDVVVSAEKAPPPPLIVMALNARTVVNPKNMQNEVVMISALIHNDYQIDKPAPNPGFNSHFCAFTRLSDVPWPFDLKKHLSTYKGTQIFQHDAERSLLGFFLTKLFKIDPDLIVGHDLYGYTIDTLIHRIEHLKIPNWSRIGRLKRSIIPQMKGKQIDKNLTCGRLVCDIHISSKELIRARSYDLDSLCKLILHVSGNGRQDYSSEEVKEMYSKSQSLITLINATMQDTNFILKLMYELNVLPLALQITSIAGNVMSKTLLGGRSERNEFLLLHAFAEKDFIVPDKSYSKKKVVNEDDPEAKPKSDRKKPQYAGGLVLEPKKGFYDKFILLMDFNSLYPSIIQEYNICFTTITRTNDEDAEPELPSSSLPPGILPIEIKKLVESRREVKKLMKASDLSPELKMQYNIRQMALKLTANSMYGCLGFSHSRFYAKPLAALITSRGREILMNTRDVVQKMNFEVIYGDTDSIMINTNCVDYDQVFKIGNKIKQEINKLYKHVELEVDGVFKYMLLLKKKKYAAIVLSKKPNGELIATQEYKGLDIVRRDWSQLSAVVGRHVLEQILSDLSPDERIANIREHLEKIANDLRNKVIPLPLLAITKQLAKNPEDYADKKSLPHLQVAMRINSRGGKKLKAGDTVSYVICDDGSNLPAVQRAYHVDELKGNENLLIDVNYYLSQQIHPVVSRLCEPIDGADAAFIAECLGLDPTSYKRSIQRNQEEDDAEEGDYTLINDVNSFKNCEKFSFTCLNEKCKTKIFMDGPMHDNYLALSRCRNPSCQTAPIEYLPSIQNALQLAIRGYVDRLYQNWMICEDPACPNRTRRVPMNFFNSFPVCQMCKKGLMYRDYRNADLYYQLKYFEFMFNIKKVKVPMSGKLEHAYKTLHSQATEALNSSGYKVLDFSKIFKFALKENQGKPKITEVKRALMDSQKQWQLVQ